MSANEMVAQVGLTREDHAFWGRPEELATSRPVYTINQSRPGADLAGQVSAAFSAGALLFKDSAVGEKIERKFVFQNFL